MHTTYNLYNLTALVIWRFPTSTCRGGDSSVLRALDSWLKGRWFESLQERRENFLQLSVLTHISVSVPPLCYRSSTKRSQSFCQKCRWHGAWLYGVHRTCTETAAVSCGTSHASAVSTLLRCIYSKTRYKKLVTHVESHASAVSLLESGE